MTLLHADQFCPRNLCSNRGFPPFFEAKTMLLTLVGRWRLTLFFCFFSFIFLCSFCAFFTFSFVSAMYSHTCVLRVCVNPVYLSCVFLCHTLCVRVHASVYSV